MPAVHTHVSGASHHPSCRSEPAKLRSRVQACVRLVLEEMRLPGPVLSPLLAPLQGVLHRLAEDLPTGQLQVHLCPRIAMTAEPPGAA